MHLSSVVCFLHNSFSLFSTASCSHICTVASLIFSSQSIVFSIQGFLAPSASLWTHFLILLSVNLNKLQASSSSPASASSHNIWEGSGEVSATSSHFFRISSTSFITCSFCIITIRY